VIICAIAELECNSMVERGRTGMRRAKLDTTHIGRNRLILVHEAIHRKRRQGRSIRQIARGHRI
jgi:DNA invertase Pin-like site-specific DNA recombinase